MSVPQAAASDIRPMIEVPPTVSLQRVTRTSASNFSTVWTNLAEARACSPFSLQMRRTRTMAPPVAAARPTARGAIPSRPPSKSSPPIPHQTVPPGPAHTYSTGFPAGGPAGLNTGRTAGSDAPIRARPPDVATQTAPSAASARAKMRDFGSPSATPYTRNVSPSNLERPFKEPTQR